MLLIFLSVLTVALAYRFWIRPLLRENPSFKDAFDVEDSFWGAVSLKFVGIRQKLTTAIVMIAGFVVSMNDFLAPIAQQVGLNAAEILPKVPTWCWPLVSMSLIALVQYFRNLNDKREE